MIGAIMARKALAGAFDALNRHDLTKFMTAWRDDGTFVYPGDIPESGTFRGREAVEGWFRRFFEQFPEIGFDVRDICVRNIFDLGDNFRRNWGAL
jgi:ketosteroid isomerase-like protein